MSTTSDSVISERELHQPQKFPNNAEESSIECFKLLHSHIKSLFEQSGYSGGYRRAFETLFGQDIESFTVTMTLYLDQLQQQMDRANFSERRCTAAYGAINNQLQAFIDSRFTGEYDHESQMTKRALLLIPELKLTCSESHYSNSWVM